jgi:hypothetical protein
LLTLCDDDLEDDDPLMLSADSNPSREETTLAAGQDGSSRLFGSVSEALMHVMAVCSGYAVSMFTT